MELEEAWNDLTKDLPHHKEEWWTKIVVNLSDAKRKCHNINYLGEKFKLYGSIKPLVKNRDAVEYALFFSYIEYGPADTDPHVKNMEHFKQFALDCGLPLNGDLVEDTLTLLQCNSSCMTEEHMKEGAYGSEDKHYFLDLEMAVLGSEDHIYNQYWQNEKEENEVIPEGTYNSFRAKVLKTFLQIPNIYATKEFREKFEKKARKNLQRDVSILERK